MRIILSNQEKNKLSFAIIQLQINTTFTQKVIPRIIKICKKLLQGYVIIYYKKKIGGELKLCKHFVIYSLYVELL